MDITPYQHTETVTIAASPEEVYDLVSDVTRMGEWSPVATAGEWLDDDRTWFLGTNTIPERTWQTKCKVISADRAEATVHRGSPVAGGSPDRMGGASNAVALSASVPASRRRARRASRIASSNTLSPIDAPRGRPEEASAAMTSAARHSVKGSPAARAASSTARRQSARTRAGQAYLVEWRG